MGGKTMMKDKGTFGFKFNKAPRICEDCGKKYKPEAPNQKYCQLCRLARYHKGRNHGRRS